MALAIDGPTASRPPLGGDTADLTKRQKAAIVVRLLLAEGARISLAELPEDLQAELTRQMSEMRFVDRATLSLVIEEFLAEIDEIGLLFPGGIEGALTVLDGTISAATASRLRKQANLQMPGDPWERVKGLTSDKLLKVLEDESIEVAAVLLSNLKVATAAELLGRLPGERARRIAYAVSLTGNVRPETVRKIGLSLAAELDAQPAAAFKDGPVERVGAILNFSRSATRDEVLAGLDQEDAGFAAQVRKAIFTFANMPARIAPRDIPKIVRDIDAATLATITAAAKDADRKSVEFVLGNMSKRLADSIREEADAMEQVKSKDVEEAMTAVVTHIRELEAEGEVFLVAEDGE